MKAIDIPAFEASFVQSATDASGTVFNLNPVTVTMPGDASGPLHLMECKRQDGDTSYFFKEEKTKKRIVLHFTEGYLKGDIASLTKANHQVSVPFVIARDGNIYNLWESKNWSFHLGPGCVGGNTTMSSTSVAIELSNVGPMKKDGNNNIITDFGALYCSATETQFYSQLPASYRGFSIYATFTDAQYNSLITLLRFLTNKYSIPRSFLPEATRYNLFANDAEAQNSTGIVSHVNFRPPGEKVDIGPAFDWNRVINAVTQ